MRLRLRSDQQSVSGDDEQNDNLAERLQLGLHFCVCGTKFQGVIYSIRPCMCVYIYIQACVWVCVKIYMVVGLQNKEQMPLISVNCKLQ